MTNSTELIDNQNKKKLKKTFLTLYRKTLKDFKQSSIQNLSDMMRDTMNLFIVRLCDSAIDNIKEQFESEEDLLSVKESIILYLENLLEQEIKKLE